MGNGNIARVLMDSDLDRQEITFFASGVSNSDETRNSEFLREKELLMHRSLRTHLIYFSSLAIYYSNSPYANHKKNMEKIIELSFKTYTIVRLGNLTFDKNPHTVINFFKNKIKNNESFSIQQVYRYLTNKDEFIYWMRKIKVGECDIMNITGKLTWIPDLVEDIKQGKYD